jgi:beta-lactamase regulating signal transducer with metallopeptidase domain
MTPIDFAMASLLNGICQGMVVGATVWLVLKLLPRLNPATRFAILGLTLFAVAALSVRPFSGRIFLAGTLTDSLGTSSRLSTAFKPIEIRLPESKNPTSAEPHFESIPESRSEQWPGRTSEFTPPREAVSINSSPVKTAVEPPLIRIRSERVLTALAIMWAVLSLAMLTRLGAGYRRLRQLKSRAMPAPGHLQVRLSALRAMNGVRRRARLLVSSEIVAPIALGFLDAAVLIPQGFVDTLSDSEIEHIVLHELAHLQRRDDWTNLVQKLIEAAVPVQPVIYWINSRMGLDREMACDDWVIAAVGTAKPYAASLTKVAELSRCAYEGLLATGVTGNRSQLFRRVHRMLRRSPNATPKLALGPLGLSSVLVVVSIFVGARVPQMIAFAQDTPAASKDSPASDSLKAGLASIASLNRAARFTPQAALTTGAPIALSAAQAQGSPLTPVSPLAPSAPVAPRASLAPMTPVASQNGQSHMEMTIRNGWTSLTVKVDGTIEFTDDDRDVKSLSPNGHFRLEEGDWLSGRAYDVTADAAGNLTKTYSVGGTAKPLDDEGREWLARVLPQAIRESGIGAGPRVARILRQGGPQAVIAEIGLIHSDGSKRIYLEQLFAQATLNPTQLREAADLIRGISSDGDKAQVIITVDRQYLTSELRPYLFGAAESISSDGDKRRVLSDIVQKDPTNMETLVGAAAVAKHISSDGDKAEVLVEIGDSYRASDKLRDVYFDAADSISSDGDHARVLVELLAAHGNDRDTMVRVLRSDERISSDGDKAGVLQEAVAQYSDDSVVQRAFFDAVNSISSDGDHQQVLAALVHRQGIGSSTLGEIANSAQRISSDGDKARVLVELAAANVEPVRDAFFAATDSIHSDGDRSRVLMAILDNPGTSSAMAIGAIHSATDMSSDGDMGRVLLDAADRYSKDPGVNAALRKAAYSLHSDGEFRAVMSEIARRDGSS